MRLATFVFYSCLFLWAPGASAAAWQLSMSMSQLTGSFDYSESEGYSNYSFIFNSIFFGQKVELVYETVHAATSTHFGLSNSDGSRLDLYFAEALGDAEGQVSLLAGSDQCVAGGSPCLSLIDPNLIANSFVELQPDVRQVPLPAAAWLFLSAIGALGILKRVNC